MPVAVRVYRECVQRHPWRDMNMWGRRKKGSNFYCLPESDLILATTLWAAVISILQREKLRLAVTLDFAQGSAYFRPSQHDDNNITECPLQTGPVIPTQIATIKIQYF